MIGHWSASRASLLSTISHTLILAGVVLGAVVGLRMVHDMIEARAALHTPLRMMQVAPVIPLAPLATPQPLASTRITAINSPAISAAPTAASAVWPAFTALSAPPPLPAPIATPVLLPPVRIAISAIGINAAIDESPLETWTDQTGRARARWQDPGRAVGHLAGTGLPGEGDNIVLTGHNNWMGEVFRRLPELRRGDEITLYTETGEHSYVVAERWIVPYRRDPMRGEIRLRSYTKNTPHEQLTLISCYPYLTNADRIVIIARPAPPLAQGDDAP